MRAETIFTQPGSEQKNSLWSRRALIVFTLALFAGTLFPYQFFAHVTAYRRTGPFLHWLTKNRPSLKGNLANVVYFLPFGFLVAGCERKKKLRALFLALIAGAAVSTTVEYLQAFLPTRSASWWDVYTNTTGSILGGGLCLIGLWRLIPIARWLEARFLGWWTKPRSLVAFIVLAGLTLFASARLQHATNISAWNAGDNLYIGTNWRGKPSSIKVLNFELTDNGLAEQTGPVQSGGQSPSASESQRAPLLDLRAGIENGVYMIRPASGLIEKLAKKNRFTVRIVCARPPGSPHTWGRLFAFARGRREDLSLSAYRQFWRVGFGETLGQGHRSWQILFHVPMSDQSVERVTITDDGAWLRVWLNGKEKGPPISLNPGGNLILRYKGVQDYSAYGYGMLYKGAIFISLGCLLGLLSATDARHRLRNWSILGAGLLLPPLALQWMLAHITQRSFDPRKLMLECAFMIAGMVLVMSSEVAPRRDVAALPPSKA